MGTADDSGVGRELLVSIHDVAHSTSRETRWLLHALDGFSARPRSLLVVPSEPDSPLADDAELCGLLREEAAAGAEIVLHGYSHRRDGPFRGPWPNRLRARLFAPGQAEFLSLDHAAMQERLRQGMAEIGALGLHADGFCAPGWLSAAGLEDALSRLGFGYLIGFVTITDLRRGRRLLAPSGGYMGAPRDEGMVRLETALARATAGRHPLQVFLHPQGASSSRACARVLRLIEREMRSRRLTTCEAMLDARA
jgi:predicted deacetylase